MGMHASARQLYELASTKVLHGYDMFVFSPRHPPPLLEQALLCLPRSSCGAHRQAGKILKEALQWTDAPRLQNKQLSNS